MQFTPLGRVLVRAYLVPYDLAMRLGVLPGALVIGYGPILLAIAAFLVKTPVFDPWFGTSGATLAIFLAFAAFGPLMNVGSKAVTEIMQLRREGRWPGPVPVLTRIEALRAWANQQD